MKRIAISIGHYPEKSGARFEDLIEHEIAGEWVDKILDTFDDIYDFDCEEPIFEFIPVPVGTLREKVKWINSHDFDYAIEMHFNSVGGAIVSGAETLYMPGSYRGRQFASIVQDYTIVPLNIRDRGIKEGLYWSSRERTNTPLYFLRRTNCPAIIMEPEFLQSYKRTINNRKIVDFCYALIDALETVVLDEI